jgi:hypothetical protein
MERREVTWSDLALIEALKAARAKNIAVYKRLADALPDAAKLGWRVRSPNDPDVTMLIMEHSLRRSWSETKAALAEINRNDEEILRLSRELAE